MDFNIVWFIAFFVFTRYWCFSHTLLPYYCIVLYFIYIKHRLTHEHERKKCPELRLKDQCLESIFVHICSFLLLLHCLEYKKGENKMWSWIRITNLMKLLRKSTSKCVIEWLLYWGLKAVWKIKQTTRSAVKIHYRLPRTLSCSGCHNNHNGRGGGGNYLYKWHGCNKTVACCRMSTHKQWQNFG